MAASEWDVVEQIDAQDDDWGVAEVADIGAGSGGAPQSAPQQEGEGFGVINTARGMGGRAAELGGNLAGFAATTGANLEKNYPLGGLVWDEGDILPSYKSAEEYAAWQQANPDNNVLRKLQAGAKAVDFGYKPGTTWEEVKAADGFWGTAAELVPFAFETGLVSVPDMVAAVANAPAYFTSRTEEIAQERARNDGREGAPSESDVAVGAATAAIVSAMEKFGAEKVFSAFIKGGGAPSKILKAAVGEGGTEFVQEQIEYAGESAGTGTGFSPEQSLERGLQGMAGGVAVGTSISAVGAVVSNPGKEWEVESETDLDTTVNDTDLLNRANQQADTMVEEVSRIPGEIYQINTEGYSGAATLIGPTKNPNIVRVRLEDGTETEAGIELLQRSTPLADPLIEQARERQARIDATRTETVTDRLRGKPSFGTQAKQRAADSIPYFPPDPLPSELDLAGTSLGAAPEQQNDGVDFVAPVEAPNLTLESGAQADRRIKRDDNIAAIQQELAGTKRPEGLSDPRIGRITHRLKLRQMAHAKLPKSDSTTLNPQIDDLLTAIAKAGGLSIEESKAQGIDPEHSKDRPGLRNPFRKNGMSFDAMAEHLSQYGYIQGDYTANGLLDLVSDSLGGNPVYSQQVDYDAIQSRDDLRLVEGITPEQAQKAITKALKGEPLGVGQARVVGAALDQITDERIEQTVFMRAEMQKARDLRALAMAGIDEQVIAMETAIAGEKFAEEAYNPEWTGEERTIYELLHDAESAGIDPDDLKVIKGLPRKRDQAITLHALINEARANERAAGAQEADPAGKVPGGHGEGVQATTTPATTATTATTATDQEVDLFGAAPVQEQAMADAKRRVDDRLRGTGDTPAAESFGDLLNPGRAQQTDITQQAPADAGVSGSGVDASTSRAATTAKAGDTNQAAPVAPQAEEATPEPTAEKTPAVPDEAAATAILDRAKVAGKDRLDIMRDFREGKYSLKDLEDAYPDISAEQKPADTAPDKGAEADIAADAASASPQAKSESGDQEKIGDFGEKIEGARKDTWQAYAKKMQDAKGEDITAMPLAKSWPEPDYQKMLDEGADPWVIGFIRAVRDEVPVKPKAKWKVKGWANNVESLRSWATKMLNDPDAAAITRNGLENHPVLAPMAGRVELYMEIGHDTSLKGVTFRKHHYAIYKGEKNVDRWTVERPAKSSAFSNWPQELAAGKTHDEALANFKSAVASGEFDKADTKRQTTFDIYSYRRGEKKGKWVVGKKVGKEYVDLETFDTVKEARDYLNNNQQALEDKLAKFKEIPAHRKESNSPRVGVNHRESLSSLNALVQRLVDRSDVTANSLSNALIAHAGGSKLPGFIDVPLESMPLSRGSSDMDASINESPAYRLSVFAKFLGNLNDTDALSVKGFSSIDIPGKRLVQSAMLSVGHNPQVRRSIIELIPIDVMNNLIGTKFSADGLLSDKAMLGDGFSVNRKMSVARPNSAVLAFVRAVASVTTKVSFTDNIARVALKNDPAVIAGKFDGILGEFSATAQDVTPQDFMDAFSFSGVQFGNYVEQSKRQQDLNEAYDALMDLAGILGVPAKALSLNGELGLAFGARGKGAAGRGKVAAAAHYESGEIVINLTKKSGAGSLAHEWFHALDNYFSRARNEKGEFLSERAYERGEGVRPEVVEAFVQVVQAINNSKLRQRSAILDKTRSKEYWSTGREMFARAFESYVIEKLKDQSASNDYLANIVGEDYWTAAAALGMEKENSYPYPEAAEIPEIRAAFDGFFQVVETKETDKGVALFSFAGKKSLTADLGALDEAKKLAAKGQGAESIRQRTGWHMGVDGKWRYEITDDGVSLKLANITQEIEDEVFNRVYREVEFEKDGALVKAKYHFGQSDYIATFGRDNATAAESLIKQLIKREHPGVQSLAELEGRTLPLSEVLDHDKLFAAYPQLSDLVSVKVETLGDGYRGTFNPRNFVITLDPGLSNEQALSTLLHEVQHVIQHREGFAQGGSYDQQFTDSVKSGLRSLAKRSADEIQSWKWNNSDKLASAERTAEVARYGLMYESMKRLIDYSHHEQPTRVFRLIRNEMQWIYDEKFRGDETAQNLQRRFYDIPKRHRTAERRAFLANMAMDAANWLRDEIPSDLRSQFESDPRTMKGMLRALEREADKARNALKSLRDLEKQAKAARVVNKESDYKTSYDIYRALAGEIEARNTQARQTMTDKERSDTPPSHTADVSQEEAIVIIGGMELAVPEIMASAKHKREAPLTMQIDTAQNLITGLTAKMPGAPKIHVVQDMQDAKVPEAVREYDAEQRSQGATGEPEGFFYQGEAYIVLNGVTPQKGETDGQAVFRVFAHEVLGHAGLRGAFKGQLDAVLREVVLKRRKEVAAKAKQYGLDMTNPEHRLQAAEEVLAEMAQSTPDNSIVVKAVEAVRRALRRLYAALPASARKAIGQRQFIEWVNGMTDAEIVDRFLVPARDFVMRSKEAGKGDAAPVFQRVFHGSPHEAFDRFSLDDLPGKNYISWDVMSDTEIDSEGYEVDGPQFVKIDYLVVDKQNRGKGYARRALINEIGVISKEHPDLDIKLAAYPMEASVDTERLIRFYESVGFDVEAALSNGETIMFMSAADARRIADSADKGVSAVTIEAVNDELRQAEGARFSRKTEQEETPDTPPAETRFQKQQRLHQDKFNRFRVIEDWLKERGINLPEWASVYKAEERYHGRVASRTEDFRKKTLDPLIKKIQKAGFTLDQVAEFLHAQHAGERNRQIAKVNPEMPDGGSGMTNAEAKEILAGANPELAKLANEYRAITNKTRDMLHKAGILSDEQVAAWGEAYQHYVPLKGGDEVVAGGTGKGYTAKNKQKRALGHSGRDELILENIQRDHERAIMLVEKNRVGKHLLQLILDAGHPDLFTIDKPKKRAVLRNNKSYKVYYNDSVVEAFNSLDAARSFVGRESMRAGRTGDEFTITLSNDPTVAYMASPMLEENETQVYVDGHAVRIQFNDELLARAYNNLGTEHLGAIMRAGRHLNSYLSRMYTGYSVDFIFTNAVRDWTTGLINLTGEEGALFAAKAAKNYAKAAAMLSKYAATGNAPKIVQQYREDGGTTGAAYLSDLERLGHKANAAFEQSAGIADAVRKGKPVKGVALAGEKAVVSILAPIERLNMVFENAMRLSAYMTALDSGMSREKAASMAKNVTVNFNRKGEIGQQMNALWLFHNASIQGSAVILHALFKGKHKHQAQAAVAGLAAIGYLMAATMGGGDDDEYEKLPEHVKERNFTFKTKGGWVTIPIPYGYGFFVTLGRKMHEVEAGKTDLGKASLQVAANLMDESTIFGTVADADDPDARDMLFLAPTAMQIPGVVATNRSSFHRPIYPEPYNEQTPDSQKMYRNTIGSIWDEAAGGINKATGGNEVYSGWADVSPETLKYIWNTMTGGTGRGFTDTVSSVKLKAQGADPELREIPVARRFVRDDTVSDSRARFWKYAKEARAAKQRFDLSRKARSQSLIEGTAKNEAHLMSLVDAVDGFTKAITAKRDRIDEIRNDETLSVARRRLEIKRLEKEEEALYDIYVSQHKRVLADQ